MSAERTEPGISAPAPVFPAEDDQRHVHETVTCQREDTGHCRNVLQIPDRHCDKDDDRGDDDRKDRRLRRPVNRLEQTWQPLIPRHRKRSPRGRHDRRVDRGKRRQNPRKGEEITAHFPPI